jgi:dipeptidyl-peptidase-4
MSGGLPSERVTQERGAHTLNIAPGGRWAVDVYSQLNAPPTATLYELPSMRKVRVLSDNASLKAKLAALRVKPAEFIKVPMPDGTVLDGWRIVPPDFDSTKKYPVLMYVYGGPASPTVTDSYGGARYLWHQMLAQRGYIVVSVDNRGAAWRGSDFRKVTQYRLGVRESQDQIDAAKWLATRSYVDPKRIGIWGWSYGGYLTLMTATRGGDVFKAGLSVAPVSDWRLYDTIYTERYMWIPRENAEGYRVSSPQQYAPGLTARLMLVHGTGDDNVHPQNTLQMADRLEAAGKLFYMELYPNRTHGINERGATPQVYETFTRFILENL